MGLSSTRYLRSLGTFPMQTAQPLISQLAGYSGLQKPTQEEMYSDLLEPQKAGYDEIMNWLSGKPGAATTAEGLINEILAGNLYNQPGVKSSFESAIESPIMDILRKQTMPQIAASAGKGGTYFSTMRGQNEIDAMQSATDKIAEQESQYILSQMSNAMNTALTLPTLKSNAAMGLGDVLKGEQEYYGGGQVPLIQSILSSILPYSQEGLNLASGMEGITTRAMDTRKKAQMSLINSIISGISSGMGSGGGGGGMGG